MKFLNIDRIKSNRSIDRYFNSLNVSSQSVDDNGGGDGGGGHQKSVTIIII